MSEFRVPVVRIRAIEPIAGADAIELAVVGDYRSVVKKGQFSAGDLAIYIPEGAVVPDALLKAIGLEGKLAGAAKNRVKAIRLRGALSQGILLDAVDGYGEDEDVAGALGIVKWEPPVPAHLAGEVCSLLGLPLKYDIENFKAFPDVLVEGDLVEFTEKLHGTFCGCGVIPGLDHPEVLGGDTIVYSKGLGAKGLVFKDNDANAGNLYLRAVKAAGLPGKIKQAFPGKVVHVLGEVFGYGVQDLQYGRKDQGLAVFDISVDGVFLDRLALQRAVELLGVPRVPVVYRGPFTRELMLEHTRGKTVMGQGSHLREGVVITPLAERRDDKLGRVILKSVSEDYLFRKGNQTEFN